MLDMVELIETCTLNLCTEVFLVNEEIIEIYFDMFSIAVVCVYSKRSVLGGMHEETKWM